MEYKASGGPDYGARDGNTGGHGGRHGRGGQTPQQITSPDKGGWASVAPGDGFTCATRAGGTVWCWGLNVTGQLGIGTERPQVAQS